MSRRSRTIKFLLPPAMLDLLGGPSVVHDTQRPGRGVAGSSGLDQSFQLKYAAVENLGKLLDEPTSSLMRVIEANERTAQRRKEQGTLTPEESDRIARIARVIQRAIEAFGDKSQAQAWLKRSNRALEGLAPLGLLGTDAGATLVTDELGRIEFGDLF